VQDFWLGGPSYPKFNIFLRFSAGADDPALDPNIHCKKQWYKTNTLLRVQMIGRTHKLFENAAFLHGWLRTTPDASFWEV